MQNSTLCNNSYTLIQPNPSTTSNIGNPSCLTWQQWSSAQESQRYTNSPSGCVPKSTDFSSFQSANAAFYNSLSNYTNFSNNLLNSLIEQNANFNSDFSDMANKLINSLNNIQNLITPLINIYQGIVGNSGLFSLVNCGKFIFSFSFYGC